MEPHDEMPSLDDELGAYVASHRATGEPSPEAAARVRARLLAKTSAAAPVALPRRKLPVAPEWLAVAALLLVLLGARALVGALRTDEAAPAARGPQAQAVVDAYRAGDLEGAQRLASQHCAEAACGALQASLAKALGLASRLDTLSPRELDELSQLDAALSGGADSVIARKLAERRRTPPNPRMAQSYFDRAVAASKAQRYDDAIQLLQACVHDDPSFSACYRHLGATWARIGARDQSPAAMEEARRWYERFLEVAPPGDDAVPRVRAILAAADAEAARTAPPSDAQRATARSRAKELYLRAYQIQDEHPDEAARLYQLVVDLLPAEDEWAQKALTRLKLLEDKP